MYTHTIEPQSNDVHRTVQNVLKTGKTLNRDYKKKTILFKISL